MHKLLGIAAAAFAAIVTFATPASATVRYDFTALSSFDFGSGFGQITGSFSYLAPTFIVPDATIPVGSLLSCTYNSTEGPATCADQNFLNDVVPGNETIAFGGNTVGGGIGVYYYFDSTAFSTLGVHDTVVFGTAQQGQLTVSSAPEPATWAMMLVGFGGLGAAMRSRRKLASATA